MVAAIGFEPTTLRVWTECSSQLSYAAIYMKLNQRISAFLSQRLIILPQCFLFVNTFFEFFQKNFLRLKITFYTFKLRFDDSINQCRGDHWSPAFQNGSEELRIPRFCGWKSNLNIFRPLRGAGDHPKGWWWGSSFAENRLHCYKRKFVVIVRYYLSVFADCYVCKSL